MAARRVQNMFSDLRYIMEDSFKIKQRSDNGFLVYLFTMILRDEYDLITMGVFF